MGRPTSYEPNDVLRRAAQLFRMHGFRSVSVQHIVEATGLNRFALYENFGNKEGLFYAALEFYVDVCVKSELLRDFSNGRPTLRELLELLEFMRVASLDPDAPAGCLVINASLELGGKDERVERVVVEFDAAMRTAFLRALEGSRDRHELAQGRALEHRAEYLVTMTNAFMVLAHVSRKSANELMLAVIDEVESWQQPTPRYDRAPVPTAVSVAAGKQALGNN